MHLRPTRLHPSTKRAVNMFLSHGHSFADAPVCGIQKKKNKKKTLHQTEPRKTREYISRGMILLYLNILYRHYIHVMYIYTAAEDGGAFRRPIIFKIFFSSSSSLFGSPYGVNGFFNHRRRRPKFHSVFAFSAIASSST